MLLELIMKIPLSSVTHIIFDFDGVMTNNKVHINKDGVEFVTCDRRDGFGIYILKQYIQKLGYDISIEILSMEKNQVVTSRASKLSIPVTHSVTNKYRFIKNKYFPDNPTSSPKSLKGLLYVGNDLNDLECMINAEFSAAPKDSHSLVLSIADFVSSHNGGDGFVRDLIDGLLCISELSLSELFSLIND